MREGTIFVNGRTSGNGPGGFARYHREVTDRLQRTFNAVVLEPPARVSNSRAATVGTRLWEQRALARAASDGVLLSTANNGPLRHGRHVPVVHDLLACTHPHTVSSAFARFQRAYLPRLCRSAATVVTVSDHVAHELVEMFGIDPDRIVIARPGIDAPFAGPSIETAARRTAARRDLEIPDQQLVVSALVSSIPRKNSAAVIDVLSRAANARPHVRAIVAGYDGPSHVFGADATRPGASNVTDLGGVSDETLAQLYSATDVFVSLSEAEGFGMPPLEALACGASVVSTPTPSLTEVVLRQPVSAGVPAGPGAAPSAIDGPSVWITDAAHDSFDLVLDVVDNYSPASPQSNAAALSTLTWDRTAATIGDALTRLAHHDD